MICTIYENGVLVWDNEISLYCVFGKSEFDFYVGF